MSNEKKDKMSTKEEFLTFPKIEYCTSVFALGEPGSGKTYLMLQSLKYWIKHKYFDEIHIVLPSFKDEQDGQYDFLEKIQNVYIYESVHERVMEKLIKKAEDDAELGDKLRKQGKPVPKRKRYYFGIDDATHEGKKLMQSRSLFKLMTKNRHLNIQSHYCLHHWANVLPPIARSQCKFVLLYNMQLKELKGAFEEFVNFKEIRKFNDFLEFWDNYIMNQEHGVLLVKKNTWYTPNAPHWFDNEKK